MSHNGTLNISREDVGEVTRVFILKNGGSEMSSNEGQGQGAISRTPSVNPTTIQHGGSNSGIDNEGIADSDNVISGMLRSADEDVDPTSDLGADLQHIEEWLKTRSDSLSSFDFDTEIKPSEVDINDFFNLKTGVQFHVNGQDNNLVFTKDNTEAGSTSGILLPNPFPDGDNLSGSGSRRNSFTKRLETLMQVDKGLFEELLLTDPSKKNGKKFDGLPSLQSEDRGLFEELLLPGAPEEWARHAQELLLAVSAEKKEPTTATPEQLSEPLSVPLQGTSEEPVRDHGTSDDLDLMVNNMQPIKLMSPQEIENMASRPLGFEETPVKSEAQRSQVQNPIEDFIFMPFSSRSCEDNNALPPDLLTSPNSEVDSKLSSILAMDASNDTLEITGPDTNDMLDNLSKTPPKLERSISPGTFLVKLEPRDNKDDKVSTSGVSTTSSHSVSMPPPQTTFLTTSASSLDLHSEISKTKSLVATSTVPTPVSCGSALTMTPTITSCSSTATATASTFTIPQKNLLKIPSGPVRPDIKKLPVGVVQLKLASPLASPNVALLPNAVTTSTTAPTDTSNIPRPALILRPFVSNNQQLPVTQATQTTTAENIKDGSPLTFAPLKMVTVQSTQKPGTANVTITVDRKANLTTVNIVSSNNEHTVFKINTCDLVRAVSSIREPHLDPLGLTPQQLLRSAHTAHRLIQEVHQQGNRQKGPKESSLGPQNFEINQVLQEVKAPISRTHQGPLALLRQATVAGTSIASTLPNTGGLTATNRVPLAAGSPIGTVRPGVIGTAPILTTMPSTGSVIMPASVSTIAGSVLTAAKGSMSNLVTQKIQGDTSVPSRIEKPVRIATSVAVDKPFLKAEGVGVSLRPGAPPTMVSVPSVLDTLSASSLVTSDLLQSSVQSPSSSTNTVSDDDLNDENPEMCSVSDEVANKALEELGIHLDSLQCEPAPQGGKRWLCPKCPKHFPKLSSLKVHLLSHNGIRPYKCSYENCDWAFYTWYKLKRHIETHLKRRDYVCSESNCQRRFTTIYNLNTHLRLHQRPKCWMCSLPECTLAFHTRRQLEVHMKTHKDVEAPYKCGVDGCTKSYFTPNSLTSHMRSHHKEEELRCKWTGCGKKFDKPCRLKAHMRVHTGQRPFVCTFEGCNWSFQSASKLSRHQRKHTNDRKFTCPICQKSFLRSEHLKGHLLIHTGVRNFQCPIENCNAKFTAKSSLYVHLKKHEGKTKESNNKVTYHCPIDTCDKSYNSKFNLRQHMLKNHTILTTDTAQLDYITLLGEKDLSVDQLLPLTASATSTSTPVTLDPAAPSTFTTPSTDHHATLLSSIELINSEISADGNNMAPIIVMEGKSGNEGLETMDVSMAESLIEAANNTTEGDLDSIDLSSVTKESGDVTTSGGSARTDMQANLIRSRRAKKRQQLNLAKKIAELSCQNAADHTSGEGVVSFANDVILSASAVSIPATAHLQPPLLQDDAVGSELYQGTLMGHDLLTDPQSTINLRDLE